MHLDNDQKNQEETNENPPYAFSDEKTKAKIKKHLRDPNDVITENDIKNVKVPGNEKKSRVRRKKQETTKEEKPVIPIKKVDRSAEGNPVTPWDIINE